MQLILELIAFAMLVATPIWYFITMFFPKEDKEKLRKDWNDDRKSVKKSAKEV